MTASVVDVEPQTIILVHDYVALSEVKARLSEIAEEVDRTHERVYVTRNGLTMSF